MKTKFFLPLLMLFISTLGYSQNVNGRVLEVQTVDKDMVAVDMYDADCIHVVDGLVASANEVVPRQQLAHFERAVSKESLNKFGFKEGQCVMLKSTADLDIENYIFRQVHDKVQQVGTIYKMPIAVNGKLLPAYAERQAQLSKINPQQIKKVVFLDKARAKAKYGDKVVFGLVEI